MSRIRACSLDRDCVKIDGHVKPCSDGFTYTAPTNEVEQAPRPKVQMPTQLRVKSNRYNGVPWGLVALELELMELKPAKIRVTLVESFVDIDQSNPYLGLNDVIYQFRITERME